MAGSKKNRRGHGEGSIYQRERDGRWCAVVDLGWVDGKRKRVTRTAETRKAAAAILKELEQQTEGGVAPTRATVAVWMEHWLSVQRTRELRASTVVQYERSTRNYVVPELGRIRIDRLVPEDVERMQESLKAKGLSQSTVRHARNALGAALNMAVSRRRMTWNPVSVTDGPKNKSPRHEILTVAEASAVLRAASQDARLRARLICALVLGLRQGEALGLRWEDVDFAEQRLHVRRSVWRKPGEGMVEADTKSERSARVVPLIPLAAAAFAAWRVQSGGRGYVFAGLRGPQVIEGAERDHKAWEKALVAAGVPDARLHDARHTAGSLLMSLKVPSRVIADILGHADVKITDQVYLHSDEAQRRAALDSLGATLELEEPR